jgi:hypothetical protein
MKMTSAADYEDNLVRSRSRVDAKSTASLAAVLDGVAHASAAADVPDHEVISVSPGRPVFEGFKMDFARDLMRAEAEGRALEDSVLEEMQLGSAVDAAARKAKHRVLWKEKLNGETNIMEMKSKHAATARALTTDWLEVEKEFNDMLALGLLPDEFKTEVVVKISSVKAKLLKLSEQTKEFNIKLDDETKTVSAVADVETLDAAMAVCRALKGTILDEALKEINVEIRASKGLVSTGHKTLDKLQRAKNV